MATPSGATTGSKIAVFGDFENCVITDRLGMAAEFWSAPTAGRPVSAAGAEYLAVKAKRDERLPVMPALDDRDAADRDPEPRLFQVGVINTAPCASSIAITGVGSLPLTALGCQISVDLLTIKCGVAMAQKMCSTR